MALASLENRLQTVRFFVILQVETILIYMFSKRYFSRVAAWLSCLA